MQWNWFIVWSLWVIWEFTSIFIKHFLKWIKKFQFFRVSLLFEYILLIECNADLSDILHFSILHSKNLKHFLLTQKISLHLSGIQIQIHRTSKKILSQIVIKFSLKFILSRKFLKVAQNVNKIFHSNITWVILKIWNYIFVL